MGIAAAETVVVIIGKMQKSGPADCVCRFYLGDIGVPIDPAPMDFSAWFEAYLGGRWYTFDARHK